MKTILFLFLILASPCWSITPPGQLLAALEKSFTTRAARFPKADRKALEGADRERPLLDLRYLLEMEGILRELNLTPASLKTQIKIEDLSSSEQKRTLELRVEATEYRATSLISPTAKEPRSNPVDKLRKAFERKARKPLMEISKARKSLNREYDRNTPNDRVLDKLSAEIKTLEKEVAVLRTAFFGQVPEKGFEASLESFGEGLATDLIKKVIVSRDQILTALWPRSKSCGSRWRGKER